MFGISSSGYGHYIIEIKPNYKRRMRRVEGFLLHPLILTKDRAGAVYRIEYYNIVRGRRR